MKAAHVNSLSVHYEDQGPRGPRALVFSNSLGTDLRVWDPVVSRLPEHLRIIRYDTRGHGLTQSLPPPYYMGDLVADAGALIDHLGVEEVCFVGLSIGGLIGQGLAAERPERIKALVLADTASKIGTTSLWEARIAEFTQKGMEEMAQGVMDRWFSADFQAEAPALLSVCRSMLTNTPLDGYVGCCHAIAHTDLYESTAALDLPTLVVVGRDDKATPPDLVRETAGLIKGARFEIIPKAGHIPCVEQPDLFAGHLMAFLKEINWV